ncbi:hypothetical protein MARBORIA2_01770 [Methanobrevibacter arboriphilus]|uniref:Uncharacterized protein n=1 Tax=Methanobrevibacter arboriphilus TaxID=39441 RepID=A0ACA8R331_METAZ|nr:hypothetical protein MarbSA_10150 [Methanobrevibacter arboriphilus]GLI11087.1 hypothetical protein MARBORIA2_01770 [Methanobrevibacter arboriphilus]
MEFGKISTSLNIVNPLPVQADIFSKKAFMNEISKHIYITRAPINAAQSQANEDTIIPCFNLTRLHLGFILPSNVPTPNDIKEGIINPKR